MFLNGFNLCSSVKSVAVNNTARDHVANARTVLIVDANSVNLRQNLNKYTHSNKGGQYVFNYWFDNWFRGRLVCE